MKDTRLITLLAFVTTAALVHAAGPTATSIGKSITIGDGDTITGTPAAQAASWYGDHEDNETETHPNTVQGQDWDLEGMYMSGQTLSLVGGFDFKYGDTYNGVTYHTGDIFIDTTGDVKYAYGSNTETGTGGTTTNSDGYDYVIHFNSDVTSYSVYKINASTLVNRAVDIASSNPWTYASGGTLIEKDVAIGGFGKLDASAYNNMVTYNSASMGLKGYNASTNANNAWDGAKAGQMDNNHFYLTVNTSFLPSHSIATFHNTMECGNDNLMGRASVPDEMPTALLLAIGSLATAAAFSRRRLARG